VDLCALFMGTSGTGARRSLGPLAPAALRIGVGPLARRARWPMGSLGRAARALTASELVCLGAGSALGWGAVVILVLLAVWPSGTAAACAGRPVFWWRIFLPSPFVDEEFLGAPALGRDQC